MTHRAHRILRRTLTAIAGPIAVVALATTAGATPSNGGFQTTCNNDPGDVCSAWTASHTYAGQPIQYNTVWRHVFNGQGIAVWQVHETQWWVGATNGGPHPIGDIGYIEIPDNAHPCMAQTGAGGGGHLRLVPSGYASGGDPCTSNVIDWRPCNVISGAPAWRVDLYPEHFSSNGNSECWDGVNWVTNAQQWTRNIFLTSLRHYVRSNPPFQAEGWAEMGIDDGTGGQ